MSRKSKSKTVIAAPRAPGGAQRLGLFGPPLLIEGEDAAAYDELLARLREAVQPVDIIDEIFIDDVVSLQWQVLRWRRIELSLIQARELHALTDFLANQLDYNQYWQQFASDLAEILKDNLPEDQVGSAQMLAHKCARNESDAVDLVSKVLDSMEPGFLGFRPTMDKVRADARVRRANQLVQEYVGHKPDAVTLIDKLLANAGVRMNDLVAQELEKSEYLHYIERVDRLTAIAESRRNASLREIDRRVLSQTLRRSVQEVEDPELEVTDKTPANGKNAA